MKVLFLEHVLHVAKKWDIKEVSDGYAMNFLFPKKLAKAYTQNLEKQLKDQNKKKESDRRMLLWEKGSMTERLEGEVFHFELPGNATTLFWSVHPKDVAALISKKYHFPLTKKHIDFGPGHSNFKTEGKHQIYVDLGENYAVKAYVEIKKIQDAN